MVRLKKESTKRLKHENKMSSLIEPGILPVCDALNAIPGVETLFSCEGHHSKFLLPYVMFLASVEDAFKIHKMLGHGHGKDWRLKFCWCLTASFDDDGTLRYVIKANDARLVAVRKYLFFPCWRRMEMNKELNVMALLIRECFSSNFME